MTLRSQPSQQPPWTPHLLGDQLSLAGRGRKGRPPKEKGPEDRAGQGWPPGLLLGRASAATAAPLPTGSCSRLGGVPAALGLCLALREQGLQRRWAEDCEGGLTTALA